MKSIATLDDSLVSYDGLYVYAHALVVDDVSRMKVFSGNNKEIYSHEKEIVEFVLENLFSYSVLYACNHYHMYNYLWNECVHFDYQNFSHKKDVRKSFNISHNSAKRVAKDHLDSLLGK